MRATPLPKGPTLDRRPLAFRDFTGTLSAALKPLQSGFFEDICGFFEEQISIAAGISLLDEQQAQSSSRSLRSAEKENGAARFVNLGI